MNSELNSGQTTPFDVVAPLVSDLELLDDTELPIPTTVDDLLTQAAAQLEGNGQDLTVLDGSQFIEEYNDINVTAVQPFAEHVSQAHVDTDDDGFGSVHSGSVKAPSILDALKTPSTGWSHQQLNNVFAEINNAVLRYERKIVRGTLPWETGIMAQVFRRNTPVKTFLDSPACPVPMPFLPASSSASLRPVPAPAVLGFALRRIRNVRLLPSDDSLRTRAMIKWRLLIELDLEASHLGRTIKCLAESLANEQKLMSTISDAFASKSTATLFKRAQSILHYHAWAQAKRVPRPLMFIEQYIYEYVCYLRENNFSPTKAESFKQAVSFAVHTLQMPEDTATFSNRFLGSCRLQFLNKRPLQQAPPLTVEQVRKLERVCIAAPQVEDRVVAGQFLFCLYASCRFSDSMYAEKFQLSHASNTQGQQVVLIDAGTLRHKTATTRERATTFLPLLATGVGLEGKDWAKPWFEARQVVGLSSDSKPFLPAFLLNGRLSDRRMTTGEASAILKDMLADVTAEGDTVPTTHSLKATVLSWLSKDGAPLELRRIAGHHMDPASRSVLTYSRDALLSVLVRVNRIISRIRNGSFDPELSRAQFLLSNLEQDRVEVLPQREPMSESEEDIEEVPDASEEAPQLWNHLNPENKPPAIVEFPISELVQHTVSGVIHFVQTEGPPELETLRCGRLITKRYCKLVNRDPIEWPLCKICETNYKASLI